MEILFEETSALWFSPDNAVSYCAGTASETVRIPDFESQSQPKSQFVASRSLHQ